MPTLDTFDFQPLDQYNPNPDELLEFATRTVASAIEWNQDNTTNSLFANTLVESKETDENIGVLRDKNIYDTLITTDLDLESSENFKIDGERALRDGTRQYFVKMFIRIRSKRVLGENSVILQMVNYIQRALTRSAGSFSSKLTIGEGWSDYTYTTQFTSNTVSQDESSIVVDPETRAYFKEFAVVFAIYREE
jgi:hypothetical protein